MSWSVIHKNCIAVFKVKVTASYITKIWLSTILYELLSYLQPNMVWLYVIISQSAFWREKKWIAFSGSRSQWRFKVLTNVSRWYLLNLLTFCYQTWYGDALLWDEVSHKKIGLLLSRSRSQWGPICSRYDCFCYIFWTADPFATRLGLLVHHHKPECLVKMLYYCI